MTSCDDVDDVIIDDVIQLVSNMVLCDKNAKDWKKKLKLTIIFQFLEKNLQEFYKNPSFVTSCDDVIIDDVTQLVSKHVFIIKE